MVEKFFRQVDFILAACIALFLPGRLSAQTEAEDYMVVNRLTREDGLPDQDINGIYFDNQGYAWIGTFGASSATTATPSSPSPARRAPPPSATSSANAARTTTAGSGSRARASK